MNLFSAFVAIEEDTIVVGTPWNAAMDGQAVWVFQREQSTMFAVILLCRLPKLE